MPVLTVRNLSDEVHRALRAKAAREGRSLEAEVRAILEDAIKPGGPVKLGALLSDLGREVDDATKLWASLHTAVERGFSDDFTTEGRDQAAWSPSSWDD